MKTIPNLAHEVLADLFGGQCYVPKPQKAPRLKNGHAVYRISGTSPSQCGWMSKDRDGKIWLHHGYSERRNASKSSIEVSRQKLYEEHDDWPHHFKWEWHVLDLGPEAVAGQLQTALRAGGHNVAVRIGGDGTNGYATSIAIEVLHERQTANAALQLLMSKLPPEGAPFPASERARWLAHARNLLELIYGDE